MYDSLETARVLVDVFCTQKIVRFTDQHIAMCAQSTEKRAKREFVVDVCEQLATLGWQTFRLGEHYHAAVSMKALRDGPLLPVAVIRDYMKAPTRPPGYENVEPGHVAIPKEFWQELGEEGFMKMMADGGRLNPDHNKRINTLLAEQRASKKGE
jgi:hypothetical protein